MSEPYTRGEEAFCNLFDENEAPEELDFEGPEFQALNVDPCANIRDRRYWIMPCAAMARRIRDIEAANKGKKNADAIIAKWARDVALRLAFQDDPVDDFEVELHLATKYGRQRRRVVAK